MMRSALQSQLFACMAKTSHPTRDVALDAAARCMGRTGRQLYVYKCRVCGLFHLTKNRDR